jgi:hypothetical protein
MKFNAEKIMYFALIFMVFTLIIGFVIVAFYALFYDEKTNPDTVKDSTFYYEINVYTDPKTKCEYFIYDGSYAGTMTPRLSQDGKIICGDGYSE